MPIAHSPPMKSRILFTGLISIILLFYYTTDTRACFPSPLEGTECRFGLFVPYTTHMRTMDGMYFSFFNMKDVDNAKGVEADRQINVDEWYAYTHHRIDKKSIYTLLYNTDPVAFLGAADHDTSFTNVYHNAFFRYLIRPENKKLLDYMAIAKHGEFFTHADPVDPWDNDFNKPKPINSLHDPITAALADSGMDAFLRARYLYLDIRYSYYYPPYERDTILYGFSQVDEEYTELQRLPIKTVVKGWAAYFNALYISMLGDTARGNYLLAQAFNMSNDKKSPIFRHFSVDLLGQSSRYVQNNSELANLYVLAAMHRAGDAIPHIEKIYHLDPSNQNLSFLMTREIAKLEDRMCTPKYTGIDAQIGYGYPRYRYEPFNYTTNDHAHMEKWKAFLKTALADSVPKDKFFFNLCMAHTLLIDEKPDEARTYLTEAKNYTPSDRELVYQYRLTDLAVFISQATVLDTKFENETVAAFRWLDRNRDHFENADLALRQIHLLLSYRYEKTGNIPRAILVRAGYNGYSQYNTVATGYYFDLDTSLYLYIQERATGADAEAFIKTVKGKTKTPFEKYYADVVAADTAECSAAFDAAGSNYLREADWVSALRMFSRIPDSYWADDYRSNKMLTYLNADPFVAHPFDNHALSHSMDSTKRYSKKAFTRHLVKLLTNDINTPDSLLKIADAMYNMTYFGNSWILVRNSWSAFDNVFGRNEWGGSNILSPRYYDYYACRRARQWYQRAYDTSQNKEIKAKAMLMMAQCDKNFSYLLSAGKKPGSKALFDRFAKNYADTRYYADLVSTCDISDVKKQFFYFTP
ncbi:MAG: putative lipoprotein [Bacteroidetes bacterium]|nr:putative lipoprotein [Bacteroidota bacterium]